MTPDLSLGTGEEPAQDCWNRIGISGDRSCPELANAIHCRNCHVHADAARRFFDRPAPEGYLAEWAGLLARPVPRPERENLSVLILRLGTEWFALRSRVIVEVTSPQRFHRIPHRANHTLKGMMSLRGQLQLFVSLHALLTVEADEGADRVSPAARGPAVQRLVVVKPAGHTWVFLVDEVAGVERFPRTAIQSVPSNLSNPAQSFTQALIPWNGRSVGFLDEQRLNAGLLEAVQ